MFHLYGPPDVTPPTPPVSNNIDSLNWVQKILQPEGYYLPKIVLTGKIDGWKARRQGRY